MTEQQEDGIKWGRVIGAVCVVLALWLLNYGIGKWVWEGDDRGRYGDMFGAVNALFSGLAFAGLIYAVLMQRDELKIAKKDMTLTKQMLDAQSDHLKDQNLHSDLQMFETTFFQMLKLLSDITEQIDFQRSGKTGVLTTNGKDVFPVFLDRLRNTLKPTAERMYPSEHCLDKFEERYEKFFRDVENEIGHYFRVLYNLVKFVDQRCPGDKKFYSNIIRAQLSYAELELLLYNCQSKYGREKFKPLIEKYALLKHLSSEKLILPEIRGLYDKGAFGANTD